MSDYIININRVEKTEGLCNIENLITSMRKEGEEVSREKYFRLIDEMARAIARREKIIVPVEIPQSVISNMFDGPIEVGNTVTLTEDVRFEIKRVEIADGPAALACFTDYDRVREGDSTSTVGEELEGFLQRALMLDDADGLMINPWNEPCFLPKEYIRLIFDRYLELKHDNILCFSVADITECECSCIVNAANKTLLGGGGVDGAIHRAAGPGLLEECRTLGGCETGEAKITGGYNLKADYVIHTVGPIYSGSENDELMLGRCYWNCLELARSKDIHSIAFPAISTGAYRYPIKKAAQAALDAVANWLKINPDYGMAMLFAFSSEDNAEVYREVWSEKEEKFKERPIVWENNGVLEKAVSFAMKAHEGAVRKGSDRPYILHPLETLQILASMNADINLMAAGVLHDTLEDTDTTLGEIYEQFGTDVAALVNSHTEDKRRCWYLRKLHAVNEVPRLDIRMKMLVIADKVANLRNMYSDYKRIGEELWTRFNAPKALQAWYYSGINDGLSELADYVETRDVYWEMTALFKDLFVEYYIDDEKDVIYQVSTDNTIYMFGRDDCCWRQIEDSLPDGLRQLHRKAAERIEDNWAEEK